MLARTQPITRGTGEAPDTARQMGTARGDSGGTEALPLIEQVVRRENLVAAHARVVRNGGAPGVDGMSVDDLIIDGNRATTVLSVEGTHIGDFLGLPPTGKRFRMSAVFFYELENGQIVRERRIYDFTGLLLQIGVLKAKPA